MSNKLSNQELTELSVRLSEYVEIVVGADLSAEDIADKRFAEGLVCPRCNKRHIVKNGKVRGIQRYLCRDCSKTFNADLSGKHKKGIYHINHINALHNKLKLWMKPKYGVATKYFTNYMYWFNWGEKTQGVSRYKKSKDLIHNSFSSIMELTRKGTTETTPFICKEDLV